MTGTIVTDRPERVSGRFIAFLKTATTWHFISIVLAFIFIVALMGHQWFFLDEWDFLRIDGVGLFDPHVGHWSTSPTLVYRGMRDLFGLHTYWPFATLVIVAHLAVSHLVWRIARLSGANDWIATALAASFMVLGAGSENILWAFQIGFIGAIAFGLVALLVANRDELTRLGYVGVVAISLFSLTWSGTSIPIVVATALVLWRRHGRRQAGTFVAITGGMYVFWLVFAAQGIGDTGGFLPHKVFVLMPLFVIVMFFVGFAYTIPILGVGQVALVALAAWIVRVLIKRRRLAELLPALALGLASLVFAVLTAYSRATTSVPSGASSRYIYMIFLLLLPLFAVGISRLLRNNRRAIIWMAAVLALYVGYNADILIRSAQNQATIEQETRQVFSASIALYNGHSGKINLALPPDPRWAVNLRMSDLLALYNVGDVDISSFTPNDLSVAKINLQYVPDK